MTVHGDVTPAAAACARAETRAHAAGTPRLLDAGTLAALLDGTPLLLLLDIDGTLCDIVTDPAGARVPDSTRRTLTRLAAAPDVHLALVTGRAVPDAQRMVGVAEVPIVGNHGLEWVDAAGEVHPIDGWDAIAPALRRAHDALVAHVSHVPGALMEDKTYSLTVHYRRVAPSRVDALRRAVASIAAEGGLRVADGKCVLNVLPPLDVDKGVAALRLARDSGTLGPAASILFAGDDVTDETAFRALAREAPHAVTVRVAEGDVPTAARFRIGSPAALARALDIVAERRAP